MDEIRHTILRISTVPISLKILTKGQMRFLNENGFEVHTASAQGKEIQELFLNEKIKSHTILPLSRTISPIADVKAIYECYKLIKQLKPTIVHTYTPKAGLVGMVASYLAGTKIRMHNVTGMPLMEAVKFKKTILILVEKVVYHFATNVYVNSFGLLDYIRSNISTNHKIKILGNGSTNGIDSVYYNNSPELDKNAVFLKNQYKIKTNDFVWIFIGRLVGDKGINELLNAYDQISKKHKNMKLILVGPYEEALDPLSAISKAIINKNDNIIVTGFIEDVRPYYLVADCLVFPSYREGLPNVPLQAACFSLPIIASDINGCNEIVENFVNGLLVKVKNVEELKNAMLKIYIEKDLRKQMQAITREKIIIKYNQYTVWQNLLKEYQKLIN